MRRLRELSDARAEFVRKVTKPRHASEAAGVSWDRAERRTARKLAVLPEWKNVVMRS
jgi:hypothetical protein